jgi:hypothetical protein
MVLPYPAIRSCSKEYQIKPVLLANSRRHVWFDGLVCPDENAHFRQIVNQLKPRNFQLFGKLLNDDWRFSADGFVHSSVHRAVTSDRVSVAQDGPVESRENCSNSTGAPCAVAIDFGPPIKCISGPRNYPKIEPGSNRWWSPSTDDTSGNRA